MVNDQENKVIYYYIRVHFAGLSEDQEETQLIVKTKEEAENILRRFNQELIVNIVNRRANGELTSSSMLFMNHVRQVYVQALSASEQIWKSFLFSEVK
jgi:dsDNA-specific endonuclease/ATPase MutS2